MYDLRIYHEISYILIVSLYVTARNSEGQALFASSLHSFFFDRNFDTVFHSYLYW